MEGWRASFCQPFRWRTSRCAFAHDPRFRSLFRSPGSDGLTPSGMASASTTPVLPSWMASDAGESRTTSGQRALASGSTPSRADKWGAMATYVPNVGSGAADGMSIRRAAQQAALDAGDARHRSACMASIYSRDGMWRHHHGWPGQLLRSLRGAILEEAKKPGRSRRQGVPKRPCVLPRLRPPAHSVIALTRLSRLQAPPASQFRQTAGASCSV